MDRKVIERVYKYKKYIERRKKINRNIVIGCLLVGVLGAVVVLVQQKVYIWCLLALSIWIYITLRSSVKLGNCNKVLKDIAEAKSIEEVTIQEVADRKWKICVVDESGVEYSPKYYTGVIKQGVQALKLTQETGEVVLLGKRGGTVH